MTIKNTEISAQHEFLKPIYLCVHRFTHISRRTSEMLAYVS